jgi:hypothetical protein
MGVVRVSFRLESLNKCVFAIPDLHSFQYGSRSEYKRNKVMRNQIPVSVWRHEDCMLLVLGSIRYKSNLDFL